MTRHRTQPLPFHEWLGQRTPEPKAPPPLGRSLAMRCDKTSTSYAAFISFACAMILIKSVHTA